MPDIVLFGATGYTGRLTAHAMVARGLKPVLAGRNRDALKALAKELGGLEAVAKRNHTKAGLVYKAIDESGGFYKGHSKPEYRSLMNITYRLPSEALEEQFTSEAKKYDLIGLKGHRSVGGIRVSTYNAVEPAWIDELVAFMGEFAKKG